MTETYTALAETGRRRIAEEWQCTTAEADLLSLICDLSLSIGQSWCVVPCLTDFAQACGIHKSTASRALRSCVNKGYLQILSRKDETLYGLLVTTREESPKAKNTDRTDARTKLVTMNKGRLQGCADANGQQRIPGVFESEEIDAPAVAFQVMVEQPAALKEAASPDPLDRLLATMRQRENPPAETSKPSPQPAARQAPRPQPSATQAPRQERAEPGSYSAQWQEMTKNLSDDAIYCLEQIRTECQQRKGAEADFFAWRWLWRKRATQQTRLYLEAAGICKAMRLESGTICDSPGAFIYHSVTSAMKHTA